MNVEDFYNLTFIILCTVIFTGIIGNVISIVVWWKGVMCRMSTFTTYFKILAICDLFVLLVPGMDILLQYVPENSVQLRTLNAFMCKFMIFTMYLGVQLSTWVTVAMTIECMMALCFPVDFYHRNNKTRCTFLVFSSMAIWLTGLNIPISLSADLVTKQRRGESVQYCEVQNMSQTTFVTILSYLSGIGFYIALPVTLFVICDLIIVVKLFQMRCSTSVHRMLTRNIKSTAKIIVAVNLIHTITDVPVVLSFLARLDIIKLDMFSLRILSVICYGCLYLSNSINIVLYCTMKTAFRQDLKTLCRKWFKRQPLVYQNGNCREIHLNTRESQRVNGLKLDFQNRDDFWV